MIFYKLKNMSQYSSEKQKVDEIKEESIISSRNTPSKIKRKSSLDSSSDSDSFSINIKHEIKNLVENVDNISFSSESEQDKKEDFDYLFEHKYWRANGYESEYNKEKKMVKSGIKEESNKQSTQGNEDEEMRNEQMHYISSSVSNNNELSENEMNCDKISDKNNSNNNSGNKEQKEINKNNIKGTNLLINGSNFSNNFNYNNINGYTKCIFPYDHINYVSNQNGSNFFPISFIPNNFGNYNINYNMPTPNINKNVIPSSNNTNKLNKLLNDNKDTNPKKDNKNSINQIDNKETSPKLNVNMTYYPKFQNKEITNNKQLINNKPNTTNNTNNSSLQSNIKVSSEKTNKNIPVKKNNNNKDNSSSNEIKNIQNNSNKVSNSNSGKNNNKLNPNYKTIINNNSNVNITNKNTKSEKLILNLDDIASGKDTRTTIMIRNIPIKYTDNILNDTFKEFHGKYDCLYMPYDHEKNGNKGYAFINFINPLHILLFYEKFNGEKWKHFESPKICELNMAHFQGINEIQKHAKNYKELKKSCNSKNNDKIVIPIKYLPKLKKRYPKMKYSENNKKNEFEILSFN